MSKFTKFLERAVSSAKPEKEAGLVVGLTSEGLYLCKSVGDPVNIIQAVLYGAQVDPNMQVIVSEIASKFNSHELRNRPEDQGEDRQAVASERSVPGAASVQHEQ
tara:strand:+ start:337 stop:651 length:315 start_codon:yes stop_codon:yes gene_type:complete